MPQILRVTPHLGHNGAVIGRGAGLEWVGRHVPSENDTRKSETEDLLSLVWRMTPILYVKLTKYEPVLFLAFFDYSELYPTPVSNTGLFKQKVSFPRESLCQSAPSGYWQQLAMLPITLLR